MTATNDQGNTCTSGDVLKSTAYDGGGIGDGNITTKSDVDGYTYGQFGAGPHAVTSINTSATGGCTLASCNVDGISNPYIYYDANGNLKCITTKSTCDATAARSYGWTSFNMVETVTSGASTASVAYTPEQSRGALSTTAGTLYYFNNPAAGVMSELMAGTTSQWRTYLRGDGGRVVAELFSTGNGSVTPYYMVGDNLGSVTVVTDTNGAITENDSYDAWGKRRNSNGTDYSNGCRGLKPASITLRGYTGQEMMDSYCLVNLNARLYDPGLGRLLSADSITPDPLNGQTFDRYAYAVNNPLSMVDPSGHVAVYGETVHVTCVNSCGANDSDSSESMIDTHYVGTAGAQSLAGLFASAFSGGDGFLGADANIGGFLSIDEEFDGTRFLESDSGSLGLEGPVSFSSTNVETVIVQGQRLPAYTLSAPALFELANEPWLGANGGLFYTGLSGELTPLGGTEPTGGNLAGWAKNLRNFIVSPSGHALAGQLQYWGNSLKYAVGGTQLIGSGVMVGGAVTGQIEVIPVGAMGVALGGALDIGADTLLGGASFMESVQQGNSSPILDFAINGYIDSSEPTVGDFYQPPGAGK